MNTIPLLLPILPVADVVSSFINANAAGKTLVVMLMIGSILAWSIMVTKIFEYRRAYNENRRFLNAYQREPSPLSLYLKRPVFTGCPLFEMYEAGCKTLRGVVDQRRSENPDLFQESAERAVPKLGYADLKVVRNIIEQSMDYQIILLERNVVVLATAVTAAPFVGLLGTVWGVMDAFGGLAMQGTATLSAVAPGISGSLIATLVGLIVALPSLIGYNVLTGRIRILNTMMEHFAEEFMADIERFGQHQ